MSRHTRATLVRMTKKRGPAPRFTIGDAVAAAFELGIDQFTMAQVASRLSVTPPALYRVVSSREELLRLSFAAVAAEMRPPDPQHSWQQQLRDFAEALWDLCEAHPGMPRAVIGSPQLHSEVWAQLGRFADAVQAAGCPLPRETVIFALDFLGDTVATTHMGIASMNSSEGSDSAAPATGRSPFMAEPSATERGYLDRKIDFIITGLESGWSPT